MLRTDGCTDTRTDGRTDNVKTVYPGQTKFAGGIKTKFAGGITSCFVFNCLPARDNLFLLITFTNSLDPDQAPQKHLA